MVCFDIYLPIKYTGILQYLPVANINMTTYENIEMDFTFIGHVIVNIKSKKQVRRLNKKDFISTIVQGEHCFDNSSSWS